MHTSICIDRAGRLNFPLTPIYAGKLSSLYLRVICSPEGCSRLSVQFFPPAYDGHPNPDPIICEGRYIGAGVWTVYCSPFVFREVCSGLRYEVVALDDGQGNPRFLGYGQYDVMDCNAGGSGVVPPVVPPDTYLYNASTGLWYKLAAEIDDGGRIVVAVDQEGIEK